MRQCFRWVAVACTIGVLYSAAGSVLAQASDPFALTHWRLVAFGDPNDPMYPLSNRYPPTLEFLAGGEAGGYAGCNGFNVHYTVEDDQISFDVWFQTMMACVTQLPPVLGSTEEPEATAAPGPDIMGREEAYLDALRAATRYTLDGDRLTIVYGDGQELVYTRVREWVLVAYGAAEDPTPVIAGSQITLEFGSYAHVTGFGGCNRYGARTFRGIPQQEGAIHFSEIVKTEMACVDSALMDQEQAYLAALEVATAYAYSGDRLVIDYGEGRQLVFQQVDPLAGTQWALVSYGDPAGPTAAIEDSGVMLNFGQDKQAFGSGGCNSYRGGYLLNGETLRFSAILSTRMACADQDVMTQEQAYFVALEAATGYTLDGDRLTIDYGEGQQLVLGALAS